MSEAVAKLKPLLAALTADERAELSEYLTALTNGTAEGEGEEGELTEEEWEEVWADEINRRIADAEAGKTDSMPHEEFMRQMKEKYG